MGDRHVGTRTTLSHEPKANVIFRRKTALTLNDHKTTLSVRVWHECGYESTRRFTRRLSNLVLVVDVDSTYRYLKRVSKPPCGGAILWPEQAGTVWQRPSWARSPRTMSLRTSLMI